MRLLTIPCEYEIQMRFLTIPCEY